MKSVPLEEIAESIDYGVTASASPLPVGPKFLRITDIQDDSVDWADVPFCETTKRAAANAALEKGDIVFARTGATTGKSFLIRDCPDGAVFASYLIRVRPSERVDPVYLSHFFQSKGYWAQVNSKASGAAQPGVNASKLSELQIPLPPLPEQRRIAGILDQADALRRLRRQSLSRLSDLGRAIFHEMFGDTNQDNSSAYNAKVGDVCFVSSGSTPSRKVEGYYGGSIPWVKTTEVKGGPIDSVEEFITEAGRTAARLKIYPANSILVAMYGQGRTRGNVGYLTFPATVNQACAALQCNDKCLPEFMFFQLKSSYERLRRLGQGGNQPNLNAEIVRTFPIVLPKIERQSAFLKIFNDIRESENQMRDHGKQADSLFASLQHRAFRGEL